MAPSTYFTYTDIVIFALLISRQQAAVPQHLNTLLAEIQRLEEQDVIRRGCLKGSRFNKSINSLMEDNILMHPDKSYIDFTAKGKRNFALATRQIGSFYELVSRSKQKKFLKMLADPTLSRPLRPTTKARESLIIPEGMMVVCEQKIKDMFSEFGDGLHNKLLATFERLTFNQVHQVDGRGPPSIADDEMLDPAPLPEPLPDIDPEDANLDAEGPTGAPYLTDPVPDVEMSDVNEVEDSLPVMIGPEEMPLDIEQARAEIGRLQRRIDEIEAELNQAKETSGRLEAENLALVERSVSLTEQNATLVGRTAELTAQNADLTGRNATLTEEVVALKRENLTLTGQSTKSFAENARLNVELVTAKSKFLALRALQNNITDFCNTHDDDQSRSSSSVRDSGVGLYPIQNTPVSPPPSSP